MTGPAQDELEQKIKVYRAKVDALLVEETIMCSKQRSEVARGVLQEQFKLDAGKHFGSYFCFAFRVLSAILELADGAGFHCVGILFFIASSSLS